MFELNGWFQTTRASKQFESFQTRPRSRLARPKEVPVPVPWTLGKQYSTPSRGPLASSYFEVATHYFEVKKTKKLACPYHTGI